MCGIVGLFAKSPEIEERLGVHLAAMLVQMSSRGPDSAGVAVYRDPAASGSSKLTLYSADPHERWGCGARRGSATRSGRAPSPRCARATRCSSSMPTSDETQVGALPTGPTSRHERGAGHRDLQGRAARGVRRGVRARGLRGTHALGHTRMATESRVTRRAPIRSRRVSTSASCTTARSRTTTGCDRTCAARGSSSRPRTTPRSLPATSRGACVRARASSRRSRLPGRSRRLLHLRGRHGRRVRGLRDPIACKPAVLAETEDWVAMSSEWRSIAVLPGRPTRKRGSGARRRLRLGEGTRVMAVAEREHAAMEVVDLETTPLRELDQRLHDLADGRPGPGAGASSTERRACRRVWARCRRRGRDRRSRDYCAGMNKLATVRITGNASTRDRREHDVRAGRGRGQREPVGRRDRARWTSSSSAGTRPRAAESR